MFVHAVTVFEQTDYQRKVKLLFKSSKFIPFHLRIGLVSLFFGLLTNSFNATNAKIKVKIGYACNAT